MGVIKFIEPKSVAVIGASTNKEKVGFALIENLKNFKGKVIPINPKYDFVFNFKCYPSILNYENKVDLAIIAIPAEFVAESLIECGKKGIQNVIIISAGFSEIGNIKGEQKILEIAKKYEMRILGPNCFGIVNPYINLDTTFAKSSVSPGKIVFLSQSGALWSYIADLGIGFRAFVSLGNMSDVDFSDFLEYFNNDEKTESIIFYIEKLKDGRRFLKLAKNSRKPIFVVKAGESEPGIKATISHTGSLATDYKIYAGAFKQAKINLCSSLIHALEKSMAKKILKENNIKLKLKKEAIIITNAGGAGALTADYLLKAGIKTKIIDLLGTAKSLDYKQELIKHLNEGKSIIILMTPQKMTDIENIANEIVSLRNRKIVCCFLGKKSVKIGSEILRKEKIFCFNTLEEFRRALI